MLTCYDFTTARVMQEAGIPALLVGDSAANVILGHPTTLPVPLEFMIEISAAVRRGAPNCLVIADMPFGSYQASASQAVKNVTRMLQLSSCDCVKVEVAGGFEKTVTRLADAGIAVVAHLGLRPQSIGLLGSYKAQGRTADDARRIVDLAVSMQHCGAAAILLEAVPPVVSAAVVAAVDLPVIGCGAGPACHAHVVVTHDAVSLTDARARFVPVVGDVKSVMKKSFAEYVRLIDSGQYPSKDQCYESPPTRKLISRKRSTSIDRRE